MYFDRIEGDNTGDVIKRRKNFESYVRTKINNLNKRRAARPRRLRAQADDNNTENFEEHGDND